VALSRVLITVPSLAAEFGGPVVKARRLAGGLRALGCQVSVIGVGSAPDCVSLPQLGRFHTTPVPAGWGPLRKLVRQADIVHVLGFRDPVGTAAAVLAWRAGVPYLLEPAGMYRRRVRSVRLKAAFDRVLAGRVIGRATGIVATSRLEARELEEDGVRPEVIQVRPNGVDTDGLFPRPARGELRERLKIPPEVPVVLSLGRITAKKGLLDLAQALARLPAVWGLIAGPDDGDGTLGRLLAARAGLGLEGRLRVLDKGLWGRDKARALVDADVFCLASATENFGSAAVEASVLGLPVVISDESGATEWLDPAASRVVPFGDVATLAAALQEVIGDPAVRAAAEAAAPGLRQRLDWQLIAGQQLRMYEAAMGVGK
jgi:glycosyltransferase involved in cell wall biosynthesis